MGRNTSKIIVYSAILDDKDTPRSDGVLTFTEYNRFTTGRMNAKIYKVLPHLFLDTEWSIWIDGNVTLNKSPEWFIEKAIELGKDIVVFAHPERDCLYDEADVVKAIPLDDANIVDEQTKRYADEGFPRHYGLGACYIIIRKHTEEINRLNEKWWAEICRHSSRDQISFPYVYRDAIGYLPKQSNRNEFFTRVGHAKK